MEKDSEDKNILKSDRKSITGGELGKGIAERWGGVKVIFIS